MTRKLNISTLVKDTCLFIVFALAAICILTYFITDSGDYELFANGMFMLVCISQAFLAQKLYSTICELRICTVWLDVAIDTCKRLDALVQKYRSALQKDALRNRKGLSIAIDRKSPIPIYAHGHEDAGCDLYANLSEPLVLKPGDSAWVGTGVQIAIPNGLFALQCPRSGLACNHGVTLANAPGVIDPGYRGEIKCKLVNLGKDEYTVEPGERIAQLVFVPFAYAQFDQVDKLPDSSRGENGYGSTGRL